MLTTRSACAEGGFCDKLHAAAACPRLKPPCPDIPLQFSAFFLPATPRSLFSLWQSTPEMPRCRLATRRLLPAMRRFKSESPRFWPATRRFLLEMRRCRPATRHFMSATRRFRLALRRFWLETRHFKSATQRFQLASPQFKPSARQKKAAFSQRKHEPAARCRRNQINRSHHLRGGTHHAQLS